MKKIISLLLTLTFIFALCACGATDPNLGRYNGSQIDIMGWMDMSEVFEGESYIELEADGEGTIALAGESASLTWTLDGEDITITIEEVDSTGTLKDGVLTLDDFLGTGFAATFVKEGTEDAAAEDDADAVFGDATDATADATDATADAAK